MAESPAAAGTATAAARGRWRRWVLFKRLVKRETWRLKFLGSAFKWKRLNLQISFIDDVLFRLVSVLEALVLITRLCFFYVFCGCHF